MTKLVFWAFLIIPWLSLFFLKNTVIRRYMPVALLATVMNTIIYQIAWTYHWWSYKETLFSWDKIAQVHTVYSVFLVGTIWIFYFTFRKFWLYFVVNLIVDCIYEFGFRQLWKSLKITTGTGSLTPVEGLLIMMGMALILYLYQMWQEGPADTANER